MRVYIVRHGEAAEANSDSARPLSVAGRAEVARLAEFAARTGIRVGAVWHSQKTRARETAKILHTSGGLGGRLMERDGLLPEDDAAEVAAELEATEDDVCIVGHLPHVAYLASALALGPGAPAFLRFGTATMACLERESRGAWRLLWHVNPALL
jgi:phosphohistidine phosphatase